MAFFENILDFVTDKSKRLSSRATIVIISILMILLADNIIGFSYYYNKERQIEQLINVTELLKDPSIDSELRSELLILQKQSFKRENVIDKSLSFINSISNTETVNGKDNNINPRNNYLYLASTSGLYILIALFVVPVLLLTTRNIPFLQLIAMLLVFLVIMFFTSWFNYWLFEKIIPSEVFGSWTWNYIINFMLQIVLGIGLYWTSTKFEKLKQ